MSLCLHRFEQDVAGVEPPQRFTWPFHYAPHPLSVMAAQQVMRYVETRNDWADELQAGKMLGVLVVRDANCALGFLAAYSGNLCGRNDHAYFVPPVYDLLQPDGEFRQGEAAITAINHEIERMEQSDELARLSLQLRCARCNRDQDIKRYKLYMAECKAARDLHRAEGDLTQIQVQELLTESQFQKAELKRLRRKHGAIIVELESQIAEYQSRINSLKAERKHRSEALQERIFHLFVVHNAHGESKDLMEIWGGTLPPSGSGECCAPKLLQYAYLNGLQPVCMAEFWYGQSPVGEVRHHGHYYPACRSKCLPILTFMLQGLEVEPNRLADPVTNQGLDIAYDDAWMTIVRKPAGMLTVPGKLLDDSVETRYRSRSDVSGPVVVHRLDQETSGLVVLAKNKQAHKALQDLFASCEVKKTYIALLHGVVATDQGTIDLPLRPDVDDRPRQMVDAEHGRPAVTTYHVLDRRDGITRVELHPFTGRTHQLRVHCSHPLGLNTPIVGDMLYGTAASRLMLHAARLQFTHPFTGHTIDITWEPPF